MEWGFVSFVFLSFDFRFGGASEGGREGGGWWKRDDRCARPFLCSFLAALDFPLLLG